MSLGLFKLGGEAVCKFGQLEPYIPLTFEYQTKRPEDTTGRYLRLSLARGCAISESMR